MLSIKCPLKASTTSPPISIASDRTAYPSIRTQNSPPLASLSLISAGRPDCHPTRALLGAAKRQRKLSALYFHFFATTPHFRGICQYPCFCPLSQSRRFLYCSYNFERNPSCPTHPPFAAGPSNSLDPHSSSYVQRIFPNHLNPNMPPPATRATTRSAASAAMRAGRANASAKKNAIDDGDNEFSPNKHKSSGEDPAGDETEELDDDLASASIQGKGKVTKKPGTKKRFALGESKAPKKRRVVTVATSIREGTFAKLSQPKAPCSMPQGGTWTRLSSTSRSMERSHAVPL